MTAKTDRRTLFKMAGLTAAAALAAPQIMVRKAFAETAAMPAATAFNQFRLGDFTVTTVNDGTTVMENPQGTFGTDQSVETVSELLQAHYLPTDKLVNGFAPTVVNTGSDVVLFDTGLGEGARGNGMGQLSARMAAAGIAPEDVTVVVLTHMHPDHIGGLMEGDKPAFPNARYVTGQAEYDFWADDARAGTPGERVHNLVKAKVVPLADKMTFIGDGGEVVPGITGMAAAGHTPGHMIYRLESGGRQLVVTADTANHFVLSLQRPEWEVRFDMDKAMAAKSRKMVFDMIAADRLPFIGYHMPFPSVGFVEKMDTGYRFIPETYQFDL
ncbi:MAG: MBL fold metallo-hydrolase [Phyllobacteriaceae bacterium]|nr:MBL fold metallo-hydrolase [Phyllobacteriaceae bacterium]